MLIPVAAGRLSGNGFENFGKIKGVVDPDAGSNLPHGNPGVAQQCFGMLDANFVGILRNGHAGFSLEDPGQIASAVIHMLAEHINVQIQMVVFFDKPDSFPYGGILPVLVGNFLLLACDLL